MNIKWFTNWRSVTSTHYVSLIGYLQISCSTFTLIVRKLSALFNNSIGNCCLHSFYYIFYLLSLQHQHPLPWSESYIIPGIVELTIPGTKIPGNIRSQERKFTGTFVPRSESSRELSFLGAKIPVSEKS